MCAIVFTVRFGSATFISKFPVDRRQSQTTYEFIINSVNMCSIAFTNEIKNV